MLKKAKVWTVVRTEQGLAILLKIEQTQQYLPIYIDNQEAKDVIVAISGVKERPLNATQLLAAFAESASINIDSIEILPTDRFADFRTLVHFHIDNNAITFETRPAVALTCAVYSKTPIMLDKNILEEYGINYTFADSQIPASIQIAQLQEELAQKIQKEEYEQAANIRDKIKLLEKRM